MRRKRFFHAKLKCVGFKGLGLTRVRYGSTEHEQANDDRDFWRVADSYICGYVDIERYFPLKLNNYLSDDC